MMPRAWCCALLVFACHCSGGASTPADAAVEGVPLIVYSSCTADRGPTNQFDRCVYVRVSSGTQAVLAEWTVCGSEICDIGQGYGEGSFGVDGKPTRPIAFRCLPDRAAIRVDVCAPGYRPLTVTTTPERLASPLKLAVAQRNLLACPPDAPAYLTTSDQSLEVTYELVPSDGGADSCPLLPDAGAPPPSLLCPCPR